MTNIIITGFMGTGKTVIGKEVANMLSWDFIDLDDEIEKQTNKPIYKIFEEDGEKHFRDIESKVCARTSERDNTVISTGGGTFIDPNNHKALSKNGIVVRMDSSIEKILQRLSTNQVEVSTRPLLSEENPEERISELLKERQHIYEQIPISLDTNELIVHDAAKSIIEIYKQSELEIHYPGGSYNVHIKHDLIEHVGDFLKKYGINTERKIVIITNNIVAEYHLDKLLRSLETSGYKILPCLIPDGEQHKNINTINAIYDELVNNKTDRNTVILAFGGGVTGDLAGFVAASYMRGLDFINIPTSLLAMVDSSIGGKTGYDHREGKNIIGAFKQPLCVLIDPNLLITLDDVEVKCGMAELIKTAIIGDAVLFRELEQDFDLTRQWFTKDLGLRWISKSLKVKAKIVQEDPFEKSIRAWLNLGHTLGHGLEKISGYTVRHGEAVSIGTMFAGELAMAMGEIQESTYKRIENVLLKWGLPIKCPPYPIKSIIKSIKIDKKRENNTIRWILPQDIGKVDIYNEIDQKFITDVLQNIGAIDE